jgi:Protein of unknown function (DUF2752)
MSVRTRRLLAVASHGGLLAFLAYNPWIPWPCPVAAITGYPCPSCGFTRATRALARGQLAMAHGWHPLVFPILVILGIVVTFQVRTYLATGRYGALPSSLERITRGLLALGILIWVTRFFGVPSPHVAVPAPIWSKSQSATPSGGQ